MVKAIIGFVIGVFSIMAFFATIKYASVIDNPRYHISEDERFGREVFSIFFLVLEIIALLVGGVLLFTSL